MGKNFMTAKEALRISKESSKMEKLMDEIKNSASAGYRHINSIVPQTKDLECLRNLGYFIVKTDMGENYYRISWDESDN